MSGGLRKKRGHEIQALKMIVIKVLHITINNQQQVNCPWAKV
jgi:hypothetical protein